MKALQAVCASIAIAFVVLTGTVALNAQTAPLCDNGPNCTPNYNDPAWPGLLASRAMKQNARGLKNPLATYAPGPERAPMLIGSQSYNRAIPVLSLPGRGLNLNLTLWYNSRIWDLDTVNNKITLNADRDFPSYGFRLDFGYIEYDSTDALMILTQSDGSKHALPLTSGSIYDSNDGTFIEYNSATNILTYANGTMVHYEPFPSTPTLFRPIQIMDTNRNYITIVYRTGTGDDQNIDTITDTLGRVIKFVYSPNAAQKDVLRQVEQLNVALGTPGRDANGNRVWATFSWSEDTTPVVLNYSFTPSVVSSPDSGSTIDVLTGCSYPNGNGDKFSYGDWGIVNRIDQLSSSGMIRSYDSYNFPPAIATQPLADAPTYTTMTESPDGTSTSAWIYSVTESAPGQVTSTTATDPLGTTSTIALNNDGSLSSSQIKDNTGKILRTLNYIWKAVGTSTMLGSIDTTDDVGNQISVSFDYDANGNVNDLKEFGFGGALLRETITTYMGAPYSGTNGYHILNLPQTIKVQDSSGTVRHRTDYAYDETTPTSLGALIHNDGVTTTPRGNLTTITRYPDLSDLTKKINRTYAYDSAGNVTAAQVDCCHQKKFNFDPASQYAYLSSVVRGPDSGQQFTTQLSFAFDNGLLQTVTDENNQPTSFQYDNMYRVIKVTQPPSNGQEVSRTIAYGDTTVAPTITTTTTANDTQVVRIFDGLGHLTQQDAEHSTTGLPFSSTQFQYDPIWRRVATSNPYAPGDTVLWNNVAYDALNRVISTTPPSGGSMTFAFSGNTVLITDPAGKQRKNYVDGLGRLVRVDEPGWGDAIAATDSVSISSTLPSGADRSNTTFTRVCVQWDLHGRCIQWDLVSSTTYDSGTVSTTINGTPYSYTYGQNDSPTSVAQGLAQNINLDPNRIVDATTSGSDVNLAARTAGAGANGISVTTSSITTDPTDFGAGTTSFPINPATSSLGAGEDALTQDQAVLTATRHLTTTYGYDVFNHLVSVSQGQMDPITPAFTPQTRSYFFDDLGRLTSANTPESGTVTNFYTDTNGLACSGDPSLVCRITDARNITKTFTYNDPLNRLTAVSYSDGITPAVSYTYDTGGQAAFALGRITQITETPVTPLLPTSETYAYDNLGRLASVVHNIDGTDYPVAYGYNSANEMTSITYPSGRIVNPGYDTVGRLAQIADAANPTPYLSINSSDYTAANQIKKLTFGNGVIGEFSYNDHFQISTLHYYNSTNEILNLGYDYGTANNGEVQTIHYYSTPGVEDQTKSEMFTYDAWLRLSQAQTLNLSATNTWKLNWAYDQFGNRLSQTLTGGNLPGGIGQPSLSINTATNRITNAGYMYDNAGNVTHDATAAYTYDGANRITAINGTAAQYTYFGHLRIKKITGNGTTLYIYSGGRPIAEYGPGAALASPLKEYVYAGAQLLATLAGGTTTYHHPDHLSDRAETDASGNMVRTFGHFPYGETWYETGATDKWTFTSYERDSETGETGLNYAMFRYYSPALGRFMSADYMSGSIAIPQSLNRYAYVLNDPVNQADPLGLKNQHCTIKVNVNNQAGLSDKDVKTIEARVNEIFGATASKDGDTVSVNFVDDGSGTYTLNLSGNPSKDLGNMAYFFGITFRNPTVYIGSNKTSYNDNWAIGTGTTAAHELTHRAAAGFFLAYPDEPFGDKPNLMNVDDAIKQAGQQGKSLNDNGTSEPPTDFAKLSADQVAKLFKNCLKKNKKKGAGGGGGGGGDTIVPVHGHIGDPNAGPDSGPDACPNGDCGSHPPCFPNCSGSPSLKSR